MDLDNISCETCLFYSDFRKKEGEDKEGKCHRFPPVLDPVYASENDDYVKKTACCWSQPLTWAENKCGEWKDRKNGLN